MNPLCNYCLGVFLFWTLNKKTMTKDDLKNDEYSPYYKPYIQKTEGLNLKEGLKINGDKTIAFFESVPEDKLTYRYEVDKWTVKEIIQHIIDTERIFAYRALCIARKDKTLLPGFDQDLYVENCEVNHRSIHDLTNEYKAVRLATIMMFNSFNEQALLQNGNASNNNLSVRAVGFIIMGHESHHCEIITERYL